MLIKRAYLLLTFAFLATMFLLGSGTSASSLTITANGLAVGGNGEFDFATGIISIQNSHTTDLNVYAYRNNFPLKITAAKGLKIGQSFPINLLTSGFASADVLRFEVGSVMNSSETFLENISITLKPTPPVISNFIITPGTPIKDDSTTFSVDIADNSPLNDSSIIATVSVNSTCTPAQGKLTLASLLLAKVAGTAKYQSQNFVLEYPCEYTFTFNAKDVYGNIGTLAPKVNVLKLIAKNFTVLKNNNFVLTSGNGLNFDVTYSGSATSFAQGVEYFFDFDSEKYGVHEVKYAFNNDSDKKAMTSETVSADSADFKTASDLAYVASLKDGFKVDFTGNPAGKACFNGTAEKDVILYCSKATASECATTDWKMKQIADYTTGCAKQSEPIGSFFVLGTCDNSYWDSSKKECKTTIEDSGSSSSDSSDTSTKKSTTKDSEPFTTKSTINELTNTNTTNATTKSEGGALSGFGSFLLDNKGTTIPIGIGILLAIGLGVFIVMRKGGLKSLKDKFTSKTSSSDKPSIHELAKKHDVSRPTNPKDAKKLKEFADVALMMGHNARDLADSLKYRGWDAETVDQVFKQFGNQ